MEVLALLRRDRVGVSRLLLPVREAAASRVLSQMDTVATNGGRVAALPQTRPSWSFAAASAGRLARRNRTVWERRSRPSVMTTTGPSWGTARMLGRSRGSPGHDPKARSGFSRAWKPSEKRRPTGSASMNRSMASSSSQNPMNPALVGRGGRDSASGANKGTCAQRSPSTAAGSGRRRSARATPDAPRSATWTLAITIRI